MSLLSLLLLLSLLVAVAQSQSAALLGELSDQQISLLDASIAVRACVCVIGFFLLVLFSGLAVCAASARTVVADAGAPRRKLASWWR